MTGHLSVWSGKRVKVHLRSGRSFVAKFKQRRHLTVEFYDHDPVANTDVRTLSIYKGP